MESTPRPRPARRIGDATSTTSRRGFASIDKEKQRAIASQGGKVAAANGQGHKWTAEEAREAGRKGGLLGRRGKAKLKA
ncbi:MAG: KGG domain-containing protein [Janthinobacterium lividum]